LRRIAVKDSERFIFMLRRCGGSGALDGIRLRRFAGMNILEFGVTLCAPRLLVLLVRSMRHVCSLLRHQN